MLERLFEIGPDRWQHFEIDHDPNLSRQIDYEALVLAKAPGRTLVAFVDRDLNKPSWIPDNYLHFEIYPGQPHEEFGFGIATLSEWLWLALDQLTCAALKAGRNDRSLTDAEKRRDSAVKLRRQEKSIVAAIKKRRQPKQGDLFR